MKKLDRKQEVINCGCGCGETLGRFDKQWRSRKFITGHNAKVNPPMCRPEVAKKAGESLKLHVRIKSILVILGMPIKGR